jgi:hypothetical protein
LHATAAKTGGLSILDPEDEVCGARYEPVGDDVELRDELD